MDTKHTLLDVAERLARTQGFEAFSYADLSREVGIRKASIHHHFPAKADLALSLIKRYAKTFADALAQIEAENATAAQQLQAYVDAYEVALGEGTQVCLCVAFSASKDSFDKRVLSELTQFHAHSLDWLTRLFERGQIDYSLAGNADPKAQAYTTLALVEGAQLMGRAANDAGVFRMATKGLVARGAQPNSSAQYPSL